MSLRQTKLEYEVINAATGLAIFTSPNEDIAKTWARDNGGEGPGKRGELVVEEVETLESRRRVFKPRPKLALVQAERAA